ncbi:hypothetical protein [uncultured Ferrovibrio sp.]|jgi:hypothetical protein|uniref:hypothetical protein n=1 Tax=uncultured Ferrovibrio sp. TaxID=1576913 RepID=UPI00261F46B1|nr:hypothetical protein [uncultured Ferrovibrio sp.]
MKILFLDESGDHNFSVVDLNTLSSCSAALTCNTPKEKWPSGSPSSNRGDHRNQTLPTRADQFKSPITVYSRSSAFGFKLVGRLVGWAHFSS